MPSRHPTFSEWVTSTGRALGYTNNAALARALGVQQSTVSRWKTGSKPSVEHLNKISELFGVDLKVLLVLAGYIEAAPLSPEELQPAAARTNAETMIDAADLTGEQKELLQRFWVQRLEEEESRLTDVIAFVERVKATGIVDDYSLEEELENQSRTAAPRHFQALVNELTKTMMAVQVFPEDFEEGQKIKGTDWYTHPDSATHTPSIIGFQLRSVEGSSKKGAPGWRVVLTGLNGEPVMWSDKLPLGEARNLAFKHANEMWSWEGDLSTDAPEKEDPS